MALSNFLSGWIALRYTFKVDESSWLIRSIVTGIGLTLMGLRQFFVYLKFAEAR